MTKADLVNALVDRGYARSTAMEAVDDVVKILSNTLAKGETITLRGLGTLKVRIAKEKIGRNITKGSSVVVPEHKTVKLIISKKIKDALKK